MKKVYSLMAVAGLALAAAGSAHAQVGQLLGSGDIKAGIFGPSGSTARNYAGSSQLSIGADYTPPGIPGVQPPTFYADYQGGSKANGHVNTMGIGVATKYTQGLVGAITKSTPYAGIGIGLYRVDVKNPLTVSS